MIVATEQPEQKQGIRCRKCGSTEFRVVYTRRRDGFIIRRRECLTCQARILTKERESGVSDA